MKQIEGQLDLFDIIDDKNKVTVSIYDNPDVQYKTLLVGINVPYQADLSDYVKDYFTEKVIEQIIKEIK